MNTAAALITLTTDFGTSSPYVAQMKGVVLAIQPAATIVDVTHAVAPQDVRQGAIALADSTGHFPPGTVHIGVVDPGVGTARKIVAARIGSHRYVAPDNGLLSLLIESQQPDACVEVSDRRYARPEISPTFHGRDIMAPAAAHLAGGVPLEQLGPPIEQLVRLDWPEARVTADRIEGCVWSIDAFGNLTTNIMAAHLASIVQPADALIECGAVQARGIHHTYGDVPPGQPMALIGSSGRLELAVSGGSAASTFQVGVGQPVTVRW